MKTRQKSDKNLTSLSKKSKPDTHPLSMNELTPSPKTPKVTRSRDNLSDLLNLVNNPDLQEGEVKTPIAAAVADVPDNKLSVEALLMAANATLEPIQPKRSRVPAARVVEMLSEPMPPAFSEPKKPLMSRVFTTGRLKAGKDFLLSDAGFEILAFAEPLYQLARYFFGEQPKDLTRDFLQKAGTWGRGGVSAESPLSVERATFTSMIRSLGAAGAFKHFYSQVDFEKFGSNPDIWTSALLNRAKVRETSGEEQIRLGVSGCRFQNEFEHLKAAGFVHFHIMCSPQTWTIRLKKVGLEPNSASVKHESEAMAARLDNQVYQSLSKSRTGPKLRVVWCDELVPPPSSRLLTVAEFKREVGL